MKKAILFSVLGVFAAFGANATYYKTQTGDCNPAAMRMVLDDAVREHRAVITEVTCETVRPAPVTVYAPAPVYTAPAEYIPVVDCVPGPTVCEYCGRY